MEGLYFDIRWTDNIDEKYISDFLYVQNEVFNCGTREEFRKQFEENLYGKSLIVVVYSNGSPIAARAVWRNDIKGVESYQLGSNCVLPEYRGKGIFTEMTKRARSIVPENTLIYTFPNSNSYPGYVKMKWHLMRDYRLCLYTTYKNYIKEHPLKIDDEYALWWLVGRPLTYTRIGGHYFLLQRDRRAFCYKILGEVSKDIAQLFPRTLLAVVFYKSTKKTWYNKVFGVSHLVTNTDDFEHVPTWKIDAV